MVKSVHLLIRHHAILPIGLAHVLVEVVLLEIGSHLLLLLLCLLVLRAILLSLHEVLLLVPSLWLSLLLLAELLVEQLPLTGLILLLLFMAFAASLVRLPSLSLPLLLFVEVLLVFDYLANEVVELKLDGTWQQVQLKAEGVVFLGVVAFKDVEEVLVLLSVELIDGFDHLGFGEHLFFVGLILVLGGADGAGAWTLLSVCPLALGTCSSSA